MERCPGSHRPAEAYAPVRAGQRVHQRRLSNCPDVRSKRNRGRSFGFSQLHRQLSHPCKRDLAGDPQRVQRLQILLQRRSSKLDCRQTDLKQRWLDATGVAHFTMSVLTVLRQHLREGGHYVQMQPVEFIVEALRVPGSLGLENRYGVSEVLFFLCRDAGESFAQTPWRYLRDA